MDPVVEEASSEVLPGWATIFDRSPMAVASSSACSSTSARRFVPDVGQRLQHGGERRSTLVVGRREVGAPVEGAPVRGEEDAHRPAAAAGDRLHGLHVDGVHVRSLFAVDFDAYEALVEPVGHNLVLERLVCHHMAPVAGRVAHRQEDRLVLCRGFGERLLAPRVPVDGIVAVLLQVGGELAGGRVSDQGQGARPSSSGGTVGAGPCPNLGVAADLPDRRPLDRASAPTEDRGGASPTGASRRVGNSQSRHPVSWTACAVETNHQRPSTRVRHPGRESNPVLSCSHDEAVIQTQGAPGNLRPRCDIRW